MGNCTGMCTGANSEAASNKNTLESTMGLKNDDSTGEALRNQQVIHKNIVEKEYM
jgi:hypothetical protein